MAPPPSPTREILERSVQERDAVIERIWLVIVSVAAVAAVMAPLQNLHVLRPPPGLLVGAGLSIVTLVAFRLRQRLNRRSRAALPVIIMMAAAAYVLFRSGLAGIGLLLLMAANIACAMVFSRRIVVPMVLVSGLFMAFVGAGFVTGVLVRHETDQYFTSAIGWLFALGLFFALTLPMALSIMSGRRGFFELTGWVVTQIEDLSAENAFHSALAFHDPLTGLGNRRFALDRLEAACRNAELRGGRVAALFLDLDGFKSVNDSLGHEAGDQVLVCVARRLETVIRDSATVARLGGDEFLVIIESPSSLSCTEDVISALHRELSGEMAWRGHDIRVGASLGVAHFPTEAQSADQLLRMADQAMYATKVQRRALSPNAASPDLSASRVRPAERGAAAA